MVAYNFQKQFADAVSNGAKTQTIRAPRKSRHARVGDPVQLYTGMRHPSCRKLCDPDPKVIEVQDIVIHRHQVALGRDPSSPRIVGDDALDHFARCDGFKNWGDLSDWFKSTHGLPFEGVLIKWQAPTPKGTE